jgi:hypothetical protein
LAGIIPTTIEEIDMNEYQIREKRKYDESHKRLEAIVAEFNELDLGDVTEFTIEEMNQDYDFVPRYLSITALIEHGPIEIMCERDGYGFNDRWEFRAAGWPTYTDENGSTCTVDPSGLWNPKANRPVTTAAQDREPKAIAKQIANKILPEYMSIYARCTERAESAQGHSDETADAKRRLAKACGDEGHSIGRRGSGFYCKDIPGDTLRVEFNSIGDVGIRIHALEMVEVIGFIRNLRAEKVAA